MPYVYKGAKTKEFDARLVKRAVAQLIRAMLRGERGNGQSLDIEGLSEYEIEVLPDPTPSAEVQFKARREEEGAWHYFKLRVSESY